VNGYLIAEEGPLAGMTIVFEEEEEGNTWSLGRDPETSAVVLEDPMVSRQHAQVRMTPEGFLFENLSTVNPATQNGMVIADPVLLKEGDILQIGSTFFRFTEREPEEEAPEEEGYPEFIEEEFEGNEPPAEMRSELHFGPSPETRWLLKVISGPNSGAEFAMHRNATYLIGKDPNICDVIFQDLSVSRQHARLTIDKEDNVFIEDLGSRNGVIVNGELISDKQLLASQDLVALGTTTFLVIDRHEARETIISPPAYMPKIPKSEAKEAAAKEKAKKDWKDLVIPKKHLVIAGIFGAVLFAGVFGLLSLFKSEPILVKHTDEKILIQELLISKFPGVEFSFNAPSGKLFLTGHVMTTVDHQELLYLLKEKPYISNIDDNVVIDELVWQNMNALLSKYPDWTGVSMFSPEPGRFVLRGYIPTSEDAESLSDFIHLNFEYLDRLETKVIIEKNLQTEIESLLVEKGFAGVAFNLTNGEVVFSGRIDEKESRAFNSLVGDIRLVPGIRVIKNYVVVATGDSSRINLSTQYAITGYSKSSDKDFFVVINGRILGQGDLLDGMLITTIKPRTVLLERQGMKYVINYNPQ
jgi:type III secretion system YscD/HrpQ family protein